MNICIAYIANSAYKNYVHIFYYYILFYSFPSEFFLNLKVYTLLKEFKLGL